MELQLKMRPRTLRLRLEEQGPSLIRTVKMDGPRTTVIQNLKEIKTIRDSWMIIRAVSLSIHRIRRRAATTQPGSLTANWGLMPCLTKHQRRNTDKLEEKPNGKQANSMTTSKISLHNLRESIQQNQIHYLNRNFINKSSAVSQQPSQAQPKIHQEKVNWMTKTMLQTTHWCIQINLKRKVRIQHISLNLKKITGRRVT